MDPKRIVLKQGQESVWDYPRPPRVEKSNRQIEIYFNGVKLVDSTHTWRILETSHPPVYYIPPEDIKMEYLSQTSRTSFCEWKGQAAYYSVQVGEQKAENAAWTYPQPNERYSPIRHHLAFYPHLMDECLVDGEKALPQTGGFYGGWITHDIVGPFKGEAGSEHW
jgi:uncharacterized protein (DUF427 family)